MPLHKIEKIKTDRYLAIWHIDESFDELFAALNPVSHDSALVATFKNQKKQLEWLAGRLCLRHLCLLMDMPYHGVVKNNNGKPFLKNNSAEISLTHSFPYVAAVVDKKDDVGIDLEQPREKLRKVAHKFLNEKEIKNAENDLQALCIYWCAKETLYKICDRDRLSFKDDMYIEPFKKDVRGTLIAKVIVQHTEKRYTLEYCIEKDYIMTLGSC